MKCFAVLLLFSLLATIAAAPVAEPEKEQTTAAPKADDDSQKESVETPNVKTDDSPRDKPDMSQVDFMQQVITSVMKQVADGFKDRLKVLPFVL
ncbi:uncharacterized protein LOC118511515 [Anopheles stephensi]|uniref:Hypothetical salivary protein 8.2 n=1 Tax=Anopheles stephensi TaxID=30069 RepID=Q8I6Q8_ANOST|nr:uncharacterized protein LOC118511515 [Anopheles stephensi]AAO06823.1 hypothetical salivary protein 8.2 [Anopheles stephensi]